MDGRHGSEVAFWREGSFIMTTYILVANGGVETFTQKDIYTMELRAAAAAEVFIEPPTLHFA